MCTTRVTHSLIKVEENKRKAVFRNPNRVEYEISDIDDCVIKSGVRCDKLVSRCDDHSALVELKGSNVAHACDQLFTSAKHDHVKPLLKEKIGFLVICSRYPKFDTFVRKAKDRAAAEFKGGFHVVQDRGEFDIDRVTAIDGPY